MGDWLTIHVGALVLVAAIFGGMLFFMALFAPAVFRFLPRETAAPFMRQLFPVYFRVMGIVTVLPTLCLLGFPSYWPEALTLLAVAAVFFAQRYALLPLLNRRREAGDETGAKALHKLSVVIHLLQWAAVAVTLVRLAA